LNKGLSDITIQGKHSLPTAWSVPELRCRSARSGNNRATKRPFVPVSIFIPQFLNGTARK
jgi:hypothetical protein